MPETIRQPHDAHTLESNLPASAAPARPLSFYYRWKGILDRLAAFLLLVPGLPMIGLLVVLIRLNSKGPGVYRQARVGKDGQPYTMYKLRSMRCDAEAKSGPVWSAAGQDPRVTRLGYWLRKLHLDELPQLLNVLRGEMSLIGPRPERPEFVKVLAEAIPGYNDRLRVLPGITGLAQINLPPDTDLNSVRRKLVLDLEYIDTASFLLDLRMFLCTLFRMIGIKGTLAMRAMWLTRTVHLADVADAKVEPAKLAPEESFVPPELTATTSLSVTSTVTWSTSDPHAPAHPATRAQHHGPRERPLPPDAESVVAPARG